MENPGGIWKNIINSGKIASKAFKEGKKYFIRDPGVKLKTATHWCVAVFHSRTAA
jgi:hypothetical protein